MTTLAVADGNAGVTVTDAATSTASDHVKYSREKTLRQA